MSELKSHSLFRQVVIGYVLEMGRFVAEGGAECLMNDERLVATYLGSKSDKATA